MQTLRSHTQGVSKVGRTVKGAHVRPARRAIAVRAEKNELAEMSAAIGLPMEEGVLGFTPFAENWCGRWAMMGFVSSIVVEGATGRGTLAQLGLPAPSPELLTLICGLAGLGVLVGSADTANKIINRTMSSQQVARYKSFLGLNNPNDFKAAAAAMKRRGDFTTLDNSDAAVAAARAAGLPADRVLGLDDRGVAAAVASELKATDTGLLTLTKEVEAAQVDAAAAEAKARAVPAGPSMALAAAADVKEVAYSSSAAFEAAYARSIELSNGRAAMLGFLTAIVVEAATGKGILMQLIMWGKVSGLLGAESGF